MKIVENKIKIKKSLILNKMDIKKLKNLVLNITLCKVLKNLKLVLIEEVHGILLKLLKNHLINKN